MRVNGDVAFLKAALVILARREAASPGSVFDSAFIEEHTEGLDALLEDLRGQDLDGLVASSGLSAAELQAFCDLVVERPKMIVCWAMGLTQHRNGVENIREVVNLLLLRGAIGKPSAGTCPGQGTTTSSDHGRIWERPTRPSSTASAGFDFEPRLPTSGRPCHRGHGLRGEGLRHGRQLPVRHPDTDVTAAALRRCTLTAHVSTKLNRATSAGSAALISVPRPGKRDGSRASSS